MGIMSAYHRLTRRATAAESARGSSGVASGFKQASPAAELLAGLSAEQAVVSPKYLYDRLGSKLFEAITELPEYYPTRTEREILAAHAAEIAQRVGPGCALIDLGAGNCAKARSLFGLLRPVQYVAVDLASEMLHDALGNLQHAFPEIEMRSLEIDFSAGLALSDAVRAEKRLFFYPGSSIGNFAPDAALRLLADIRRQCGDSGSLLIGVDLVKPAAILEAAYDDALGVTAAFNLNMLGHLNVLIGSDFDPVDWSHSARFNDEHSRIEMHLEARRDLAVSWDGGGRRFCRGERIHTENSYKYRLDDFRGLLAQAGFGASHLWTDDRNWFAVCLATI